MNAQAKWNPLLGRTWLFVTLSLAVAAGAIALGSRIVARSSTPTLALYVVPGAAFAALGLLWCLYRPPRAVIGGEGHVGWYIASIGVLLAFAALALVSVRGSPLWKPMLFYVAYAAAVTVLLAQSLLAPRRGAAVAVAVVEAALLLGVYAAATQLPTLAGAGADTQFHRLAVERAAAAGTTSVITQPYATFAGYHVLPILLVMAGWASKPTLTLVDTASAAALVTACVLIARRGFGERAAIATVALVIASPATLAMVASVSPSKAGVWAVLAIAICLRLRSRAGILVALLFSAVAFLYHPALGAAAGVILGPALILFDVLPGAAWFRRLGRRLGIASDEPEGTQRVRILPLFVLGVLAIVGVAYVAITDPHLIAIFLVPLTHQGSQEGALGIVRVASLSVSFVQQTLLVNLSDLAFFAPALCVATAAILGAWKREAAFVATMLVSVLGTVTVIMATGLFLVGPERFIAIEEALLATLAGAGVLILILASRRTTVQVVVTLVVGALLFGQVSSYRADGDPLLSPDVPKQTDVLTSHEVAFVKTIKPHLTEEDSLSMDWFTYFEGANFPSHNEFTFWNDPVSRFRTNATHARAVHDGDVFAWSRQATQRALQADDWERATRVNDVLYANGDITAGIVVEAPV